jgi:hypothetical protein
MRKSNSIYHQDTKDTKEHQEVQSDLPPVLLVHLGVLGVLVVKGFPGRFKTPKS